MAGEVEEWWEVGEILLVPGEAFVYVDVGEPR